MADEPDPTVTDDQARSHEAANYRRQLREAQAERDALQVRVAGYEQDAVTRLAAARLAHGGDLLLAVQLADLRDDSGAISEDKVTAAIDTVLKDRPHWAKPEPEPANGHPNLHAGPRAPAPPPAPTFGTFLKNAR